MISIFYDTHLLNILVLLNERRIEVNQTSKEVFAIGNNAKNFSNERFLMVKAAKEGTSTEAKQDSVGLSNRALYKGMAVKLVWILE